MNAVTTSRSIPRSARRGLFSLPFAACLSIFSGTTLTAHAQLPAAPAQVAAPTPARATPGLPTANQQLTPSANSDQKTSATDRRATDKETRESNPAATPEIPTEFQRLVTESVGVTLPIFGTALFNDVPDTFAHLTDIPVGSDYVIGPGDELRIQLYGQVNQQGSFVVDRTGNIAFPLVGTLHVAGVATTSFPPSSRASSSASTATSTSP